MFDGGDHQREVVAVGGQREFLDQTAMDRDPSTAGSLRGPRAGINSFEAPSRISVLPKQIEVKAVSTSDVQDSGLRTQSPTAFQQTPRFQPPSDLVHESELALGEIEGVIVGRVN